MEIFFSNRIEKLYNELKQALFSRSCDNPFAKRWIIVPSPAIKSWLMLEMAKDPELAIAIGVEIIHLDQAIEKLTSKRKLPSILELSLMLEVEIKKIIEKESGQNKWGDLFKFLKISKDSDVVLSLKTERRIFSLSEKLASLFLQYGTYGGEMVTSWTKEVKENENFQVELWKRIFLKDKWPYLIKELQNHLLIPTDVEVHLFSMSFLSKVHFEFLSRVSKETTIKYYFLSPCQAFWSDIQSEKEHYFLKRYLQKKNGLQLGQDMELDEYLRDQNPLLANFGKAWKANGKAY